jgi:hypothetical protein
VLFDCYERLETEQDRTIANEIVLKTSRWQIRGKSFTAFGYPESRRRGDSSDFNQAHDGFQSVGALLSNGRVYFCPQRHPCIPV